MWDYIISAITIILVTGYGWSLWYRRHARVYWEKRGVTPTPASLIGIFKILKNPIHEFLQQDYEKYGRIYGSFEIRKPVLTVCEPDLLRDILVKDFHIFHYRRDFDTGDSVQDSMITALSGEDWKRVRTIISPVFTSKRMRQMSHIINECSKAVVEILGKHAESGEPADCKRLFGAFTLDVIASAAFATKINSLKDPDNIFVKHVKMIFSSSAMLRFVLFLMLPGWLSKKLKLMQTESNVFFKNVILQVIKERRATGKKFDDMLQLLLDAQEDIENEKSKGTTNSDENEDDVDRYGSVTHNETMPRLKYKKLSEDEIVAQCILFWIVGYETTASTLSFMAYCLAINTECQEKLIAEVDEAFEKNKELNYDVVRDMKYLDLVLSETLRMYAALSRSERTACEDYKLGNTGITIEKGTIVGFNIHSMHHDPEFFPNPEKFDPERFLPENAIHPQYAYLPFGAGPRNCLGMRFAMLEVKLCLCHILRNFRLKRAPTTKVPIEFKVGFGLLSVDELPLTIERRNEK